MMREIPYRSSPRQGGQHVAQPGASDRKWSADGVPTEHGRKYREPLLNREMEKKLRAPVAMNGAGQPCDDLKKKPSYYWHELDARDGSGMILRTAIRSSVLVPRHLKWL